MSNVSEDVETRSRSTSLLVNNVVNNCISDEEHGSPEAGEGYLGFSEYPELYYQPYLDEFENAYEMAKDQIGCRVLQKRLDDGDPYTATLIFDRIRDYIPELMTDPFGNYLCQRLIELCDDD
jgi:hypothetical protein